MLTRAAIVYLLFLSATRHTAPRLSRDGIPVLNAALPINLQSLHLCTSRFLYIQISCIGISRLGHSVPCPGHDVSSNSQYLALSSFPPSPLATYHAVRDARLPTRNVTIGLHSGLIQWVRHLIEHPFLVLWFSFVIDQEYLLFQLDESMYCYFPLRPIVSQPQIGWCAYRSSFSIAPNHS